MKQENEQQYFENHDRASKFPWSIYHSSLEKSLISFLIENNSDKKQKILVIGPGSFFELEKLKKLNYEINILDIDKRVIDKIQEKEINEKIWSEDGSLKMVKSDSYDLVYAKEVIEHIVEIEEYFRDIKRVLKSGGRAWFSTPNYGFFLLPLIEKTFLELIANINGYSRKNIHPTKFSQKTLSEKILKNGFHNYKITYSYLRLALILELKG